MRDYNVRLGSDLASERASRDMSAVLRAKRSYCYPSLRKDDLDAPRASCSR